MQKIIDTSYTFELVDQNPEHYKYDFVSNGKVEIPKRVSIRRTNDPLIYNLGFGNLTITDEGEERVDDEAKCNNGDVDKVLNTAFLCASDFLSRMSGANKIIFYGNSIAKHRLYKMRISNNINSLSQYFNVGGGIIKPIYNLNENGIKEDVHIDENFPIITENYNIDRSRWYQFITLELPDIK